MIIGTAGHIDHGKTSLVRAITGVDTDRLKEEKARGISIDLGFAYMPAPNGAIVGFVDVPGHEKFVHNMLAGATGIDFVLLVIAADDGVMPQTREHLSIIDLLGVTRGIVVISKTDLVSSERVAEVRAEITDALAGTALEKAEISSVSIKNPDEIALLQERLFRKTEVGSTNKGGGMFRLAVDRSFTLTGIGTVVTGTVLSGRINVGDHVTISPSGQAARVRSIHAQNEIAEFGIAGQRCALNLAGDGISKDAVARGDMILDPQLHKPADRIDASVRLLASEQKPLSQWMPVRLHHAAVDVAARILPLESSSIAPGSGGLVQLVLERPIAAVAGDLFILRDTTAQRTIGGGSFVDLRAPSRKRRTPERLAQLKAMENDDPSKAIVALLAQPPFFVDLAEFARDHALTPGRIEVLVTSNAAVKIPGTSLAFAPEIWRRVEAGIVAVLEAFHRERPDAPAMPVGQTRLKAEPRLTPAVFTSAIQAIAKSGTIVLDGAGARLPGHTLRLTPQDEALWKKIEPRLSGSERFRPPRVRDLAEQLTIPETTVRKLFKLLARARMIDEVATDHYFLRKSVSEMVDICADIATQSADGQFVAAQLRDRLDNGRKVAIQILEFFDRHGVTLRRGDQRRINLQRRDLFATTSAEPAAADINSGGEASPVGRPDFKSGRGRQTVSGGFDSLSLPPRSPTRDRVS